MVASILTFAGAATAQHPNPSEAETNKMRREGTCADPWVSLAVASVNAGTRHAHTSNGTDGECDVSQYNNGQWSSYDQLRRAAEAKQSEMRSFGDYYESYSILGTGKLLAAMARDNKPVVLTLNGSLVGNDGASALPIIAKMVAAGGGNMVAAGGGNLKALLLSSGMVAAGGGNVLPTAGGNLRVADIQKIFSVTTGLPEANIYSLNAVGGKRRVVKMGSRYYRLR